MVLRVEREGVREGEGEGGRGRERQREREREKVGREEGSEGERESIGRTMRQHKCMYEHGIYSFTPLHDIDLRACTSVVFQVTPNKSTVARQVNTSPMLASITSS